jgi:hypothetical protein
MFFLEPDTPGVRGPKRREAECTTRDIKQHAARHSISSTTGKNEMNCSALGHMFSHLADHY